MTQPLNTNQAPFPMSINASPSITINDSAAHIVFSAPSDRDSICNAIDLTTTDGSARTATLTVLKASGQEATKVVFTIPANAGNTPGTQGVNPITRALYTNVLVDQDGNPAYKVPKGGVLKLLVASNGGVVSVDPQGVDYGVP